MTYQRMELQSFIKSDSLTMQEDLPQHVGSCFAQTQNHLRNLCLVCIKCYINYNLENSRLRFFRSSPKVLSFRMEELTYQTTLKLLTEMNNNITLELFKLTIYLLRPGATKNNKNSTLPGCSKMSDFN